MLPFRALTHARVSRQIAAAEVRDRSPHDLPWAEFRVDLLAWLAAGLMMAALYLGYFRAPWLTGLKVLLGCISFGLFGGMLSFLDAEKRVMERLKQGHHGAVNAPRKILSVSSKMLFFVITVLFFMVLVILLMVFMDLNFLVMNRDSLGPDIYLGVFKEIVFAFGVLLFLSLLILGRYSRNLKSVIAVQIDAMTRIGQGQYLTQVPVVSNDEFGLIAAKTNDLMEGLKERDACQASFGKYLSPEISARILKGEISPEGELSRVTLLFCDLRGYTPFVEGRDPKEVVKFLNDYFSQMERAIRAHNGIVLQYIGDEIEAVFGAPVPEPDHPAKAVLAALAMRERLKELNARRAAAGGEPVRHGIGIHTGEVFAGSVGGSERLVYAMVGDAVNLASRIQALNKQYGTDILISHHTRELLGADRFALRSLGRTSIRGKTREVDIFAVEGLHE